MAMSLYRSALEHANLHSLVEHRASLLGDRVAFEVDRQVVTFAGLDRWAAELAGGMARLGVGRGDRIAVMANNCVEMIVAWVAASRLGALWCPLNPVLGNAEVDYVLRDLDPAVVIGDTETAPRLDAWRDTAGDASFHPFVVADEGCGRFAPLAELRSAPAEGLANVGHSDPLMIVYTGGTTGMPKGVVQPQGCFLAAGMRYGELFETEPDDVHFTMNQLFHQSTHHMSVTAALCCGATAVIDRRFSVSRFWPRVVESGATIIDPIATMMTLLVRQEEADVERKHRVRLSWNASSTVPPEIPESFSRRFGIPLVATYGLTEGGGGHLARCQPDERERTRSNGKGGDWYEFRIADDDGNERSNGELGEIFVRPKKPNTIMLGYFNDATRTLETFRDLWLHTGDVGFIDVDGYLHLTGRKSHWIRRRGENISAYEVERALAAHPAVREVCVVAVSSELGDDEVKAFIVPSTPFDPADVAAWCGTQIAAFKAPRFIEVVDDLPRTASKGELDRAALRRRPNDRAWDREHVQRSG